MKQLLGRLATSATTAEVINPATGRASYSIPQHDAAAVADAAAQTRAAAEAWRNTPVHERAQVLLRLHDLMIRNQNELLELLQFETGKSRASAFEDYAGGLFAARHFGKRAPKVLRLKATRTDAPLFVRNYVDFPPVGLVGVITPWNFPIALPAFDVLPALVAGNSVLHKPDNQVVLCALYLRNLAEEAGLPKGIWEIVVGGAEAGNAVTDSVDYVAFTGSTATGRVVAQRAAARLIGCSLELGGKNPAIVLPSAVNLRGGLARAAQIVVAGAVGNAGQLCVSIERCYVPLENKDAFIAALENEVAGLRLGKTNAYDTEIGSLSNANQLKRVTGLIAEAAAAGIRVIGGKTRPDIGPFFLEPAIVVDPTDKVTLNRGEVFGPVIQVYGYGSVEQAVALANDSEYGLNACVIGDPREGLQVAQQLQAGSVNINEGYRGSFGSMSSPMGGVKQSGQGRRNGDGGMLRFTEPRAIGVASSWLRLPARAEDWNRIAPLLTLLSRVLRRL
jgi:succinate-semialdehyde dehydrogenase/glutarate-semialdehyde dehydrogenase